MVENKNFRLFIMIPPIITLLLNIIFLNAASWYDNFKILSVLDNDERKKFIIERLPERAAIELVNQINWIKNPVIFLSEPFAAGLNADAFYSNWYNLKFKNALSNVTSEKNALELLLERNVDLVVIDSRWKGDNDKFLSQRIFIHDITTEIARFGEISVRRVRFDLRYQHELIKNENFISLEGWVKISGAEKDSTSNVVIVSEPSPIYQSINVHPGTFYRNIVEARCLKKQTIGRLQINWYDSFGKFLKADISTFDCSSDWTRHEMVVISPPNSRTGVLYTSGHTSEPLAYRLNSLLK